MRVIQFVDQAGNRRIGVVGEGGRQIRPVAQPGRLYDLACLAARQGSGLADLLHRRLSDEIMDYAAIVEEGRLLLPLDHPDPAHCILSGTGLDHLGSAQARDAMHAKVSGDEAQLTDSMRMFRLGLEGGKPAPGQVGVSPEWFYKGDGDWLVSPGQSLIMPPFALDGGEEPELVGLYLIGDRGEVYRVGFALGNEFADHVLEKQNYLYLAHSKLRVSSFGPELLIGELPASVEGTVRILRDGAELWSAPFLTGEANMSHSIANIEHHHFKYAQFRRPGDLHCHYFGTATLSSAAGITTRSGDLFEISSPLFGRPLTNPLTVAEGPETPVATQPL